MKDAFYPVKELRPQFFSQLIDAALEEKMITIPQAYHVYYLREDKRELVWSEKDYRVEKQLHAMCACTCVHVYVWAKLMAL